MSELIGGFYPKKKHEKAPDFVIAKGSINVSQFREWMKDYLKENPDEEWINFEMKESKNGKGYALLDTWEPGQSDAPVTPSNTRPAKDAAEFMDDDLPF